MDTPLSLFVLHHNHFDRVTGETTAYLYLVAAPRSEDVIDLVDAYWKRGSDSIRSAKIENVRRVGTAPEGAKEGVEAAQCGPPHND